MASGTPAAQRTQAWSLQAPPAARRQRLKLHLAVDAETLEVQAVEVTGAGVSDPTMLPELLAQIPPDQEIGSVTADGAYDTRKCHDGIAPCSGRSAVPMRPYRLVRTPSRGSRPRRELSSGTRRYGPASASASRSGNAGASITGDPLPRPR